MREWIYGRNPVYETLRAGRRNFFQLYLAQGVEEQAVLDAVTKLCRSKNIPIRNVKKEWFNSLGVSDHQGIALEASGYPYQALDEMFALAAQRKEPPLFLILDTLQDPQNFGSLLRTAEAVGVHGICLPLRRTVTVTPAVVNRSSGASEHLLITQTNLAQLMTQLKEEGVWIIGLEKSTMAIPLPQARLDGPLAIVVGSEGSGLRELVRKSCDFLVQLPMRGQVSSLNASIAGSIVLYKVWEKRGF
ncbi:MAG: 23S rRNA (guanosine(2251)-2'-O)-methyltransferase RlmB [Anaerolineales bacterium]